VVGDQINVQKALLYCLFSSHHQIVLCLLEFINVFVSLQYALIFALEFKVDPELQIFQLLLGQNVSVQPPKEFDVWHYRNCDSVPSIELEYRVVVD